MIQLSRPIYLDCAATTPIEPRVRDVVLSYMQIEYGNAGSRTHIYGQESAKAVRKARQQVAAVVDARPEEVIFTSGATEANNLATIGLKTYGERTGRRHILSTLIEHKAVLEPLQYLATNGFDVELIAPSESGAIDPEEVARRVRPETLLVSVMHVNNETGIIQPIHEIAEILKNSQAIFHVDAAQGFGKDIHPLQSKRIDLICASAHKLFGPKGIGCLVARMDRKAQRKLEPLTYGGGQERNIRPGTLAVPLISGFGEAADIALRENNRRQERLAIIFEQLSSTLLQCGAQIHGDPRRSLHNCINFSLDGLDSELVILGLRDLIAISNGSACSSDRVQPSHVISAMYSDSSLAHTSCRASWCHLTPDLPLTEISNALLSLKR